METTKIPLSSCIESKRQNRKGLGDVTGLARSIEVNGQIAPLIVVADGEAYQLVAGHRRTAAMKSLGLEEADAYVMDGWDDAQIAQILNAENNHRKELTEAERGRGIQTMLSLGVPISDAAVSADVPEEKAESYVRGTKLVPTDAVNLDFDVVALMGEYDDVLTEDDVVAALSKKSRWEREAVCRKARSREALACLPAGSAPVVHTDGGACYRTGRWKSALAAAGASRSMSRKGTCPDNARAEGFFGTLEQEFLYGRKWAGVEREEFEGLLSGYVGWYVGRRPRRFREGGRALRDPGRAQEEARTGTRFLPQSPTRSIGHELGVVLPGAGGAPLRVFPAFGLANAQLAQVGSPLAVLEDVGALCKNHLGARLARLPQTVERNGN